MNKWQTVTSKPIVLDIDHIDTDMIIPAQYLTSTLTTGFSEGLFKRLKEENPNFPFNGLRPGEKKILIAGENFGCGSSREHAAWALKEFGIDAIIAKSFADIFKSNAQKNGILPITVEDQRLHGKLLNISENSVLSISLIEQTVNLDNSFFSNFSIDGFRKHCLLNGIDDLDYILAQKDAIEAYREKMKNRHYVDTRWINK